MYSFALDVPRCAWFVPPGFGKTSAALVVIDIRMIAGFVAKSLVIGPKRVASKTWPNEAARWKQFAHLRVGYVEWTLPERVFLAARRAYLKALRADPKSEDLKTEQALDAMQSLRPAAVIARHAALIDVDIQTVNYDRIDEFVDILGDTWPFDMVVPDESTRLKGLRTMQGTKRSRKLADVAHLSPFWILLTGTPAPNGLEDLWGQIHFLDRGQALGRSFSAFQNRWFGFARIADAVNPGKFYVKRIVFPHAQREIEDAIRPLCLTLDPKDWFDLREPIVKNIEIELPAKARKHYREMEKEMFTILGDHEVEAFGAAAKTLKCLQIANGAAYVNGGNTEWEVLHDEKIEALESLVEEWMGAPLLVAYNFKSDRARLLKAFPGAIDLATAKGMDAAMRGEGRVWLGHPKSMGHGVDGLQYHCNVLVFFSMDWNLEERLQIIERVGPVRQKQAGLDRPTYIYNLVAKRTVDELVLTRIESKRSVQDILLEAMKRSIE